MPPFNSTRNPENYLPFLQSDANNNQTVQIKRNPKYEEEEICKEFRYFHVKNPLENDQTIRYIYIDKSKYGLVWPNIFAFSILHVYYLYALTQLFSNDDFNTWFFHYFYSHLAGIGVTVGAHRLWAHKGYEASYALRFFLQICFTIAGQNDLLTWSRDHRVHHKFTETDADPHNSLRGMFFSHCGWLMTRKHPDVLIKGRGVPIDDLERDPVIMFNRKYYVPMYFFFRLILPFALPIYFWNETVNFAVIGMFSSYIGALHATWFVNSAAHLFGDQPYNKKLQARNNFFVNLVAMGEGMHNFHHAFPYDYRIDEHNSPLNIGKRFIEFCGRLGLAYKLRKASPELIKKTKIRVLMEAKKREDDPYINPLPYC